jgi:hypothetical protein
MKLVNNSMALNEVVLLMHLSQKKSVWRVLLQWFLVMIC